ncbi:hypothetical protein [Ralstonia solanacearum]|uniref:hypothetical protein n=1 Tax=Ralstonia solanacearum TaxID=305 RepID=UPI0018D1EC6E|nr:hypothetical protein [Ralstonia solanacearum]
MFDCEAAFHQHRKKRGCKEAVEYVADINRYTLLCSSSGEGGARLSWMRTLFDRNENFIELSNMGEEDRSISLLLASLLILLPILSLIVSVVIVANSSDWVVDLLIVAGITAFAFVVAAFFGPIRDFVCEAYHEE